MGTIVRQYAAHLGGNLKGILLLLAFVAPSLCGAQTAGERLERLAAEQTERILDLFPVSEIFGRGAGPRQDRVELTLSDEHRERQRAFQRWVLKELLLKNVYFDTCVYHQPGIDLMLKVIPPENILFASEMVGAVRGIDPETGQYYDDTKRYIQASSISAADKQKIFEGNARRVYPRWKPV